VTASGRGGKKKKSDLLPSSEDEKGGKDREGLLSYFTLGYRRRDQKGEEEREKKT